MMPGQMVLPECFDQILLYLCETLPSPLYSLLINVLANSLALFTALQTLLTSSSWDPQSVLPPLIGIFAAYLALLSLYRTTAWFLRTTVWFLKWGTILGALVAGAGWYMTNRVDARSIGNYAFVSNFGGLVLDMINGQGQNLSAHSRSKSRSSRSSNKKPKIWESFERHREWQNQEQAAVTDQPPNLPQIFNDVVGVATKAVVGWRWWSTVGGDDDAAHDDKKDEGHSRRKTGSRSSGSRSR